LPGLGQDRLGSAGFRTGQTEAVPGLGQDRLGSARFRTGQTGQLPTVSIREEPPHLIFCIQVVFA